MSSLDDYISELVVQQQKTNALASTLTEARDTNPDEFARMKKLSEQAAIDMAILPDFKKEAEQAAYLQDMNIGKLWETAPKTANALVNPTVAGMAHDDVQNLSALEQAMSATGNFLAGTGKSLTAGLLFRPNAGAYGVLRAGADLLPDVVGDPIANFAAKYSQVGTQTANALTPQTDNRLLRNWYSGVNSLGSNAAALAIYVASGGTVNPLVTMGAQEFGTSYQDARSKGKSGWEGGLYAASNAAIEVGTEQMSVGPMLKMFKPGTQLGKAILEYILKEQGGEQIATHLQDLNEWAALNPQKTFGDYLRERPGAALDTAMSTLVSSGLQSGAAKIVQKVVSKTASIDEADKGAQKLANAMALAAQSKLRERSPETFQQLVETMTEGSDGKPQSVFIDANVLLQSATPEQLVEILPSVAEQLQDSATANGTLEVSIGEALTALPGTPLEQVFLQNARSAPDALSLAEATQAVEQAEAFLAQEAERVMQQASDKAAWQQSAEAVKTTIKQQLDAAGRFTPDVNDAYATLQQHFFSSMAARLGITPQEMYDRWSLKVGAQSQQTAESYEAKGAPTKGLYGITVEGRHFSREQRYALSSKMYGTGLKGDMRDKIMNHSDKRLRDRIYFYVDKGTGINPERGVGGVQHKATLDNIYDLDSDPLRIWKGEDKFLDFESAVLDAGYSGYLARNNGSPASGVVIMLGDRNINVEQLSETDDPKSAKGVGAPAARPSYGRDVVVDAINANKKNFPMGAPTRARWAEILQKQMPEEYEALRAAGVFDGDQGKALYLSNLMTEFKNATEAPSYAQSLSSRLPGGKKATEDPLTETPAARVMFEVAPDPNDAALTAEWNALSPEERLALSQQVAAQIVPKVLKELGTGGDFVMQLGGYMGATNPSMTLRLERPELALTAAKLLGYALAQDSMMVVSENQIVGTDEVGAVTIKLPEGYGEAEVTALYDRLYELQANGEPLVGGHTTADGQMVILNYSPLTTEELAATIFNHLGAEFDVDTNVVYSAFPTKDNYGYGQTDAPPEGNTAARQSPAQKRPDRLRSEATQQLRAALDARRAADGTATNRPIEQAARDVTQTPEFKAWFGDSKVVGENGEPLVVYHGTGADFDAFDTNRVGDVFDDDNVGFFFSSSAETASGYATHAAKKNNGAANVMPAYLSLQNPYTFHDYAYSYAYDENSSTLADDITDGRLLIDWFDRNKDTITQHAVEDGKDGMLLVRGNETLAVAFTPTQIKSATGNNGNFDGADANVLHQTGSQTQTPGFKAWAHNLPVVGLDEGRIFQSGEGVVVEALHETTGDFDTFDRSRANLESDLGGGFYATNNIADVGQNYAGLGPDLTNKIERVAEQLASETGREYNDPEVVAEARAQFMANEGATMPVFVRFDNPAVIGGKGETFLDYREPYDENNDEYGEPEGALVSFVGALREATEGYFDADADDAMGAVWGRVSEDGGIGVSELIDLLKSAGGLQYATDDTGNLVGNEIIRRAFEGMGFDGFIDTTVNRKFGSQKPLGGAMAGMDENTVHFVAFNPNQFASRIGSTWDRAAPGDSILKQGPRGTFNPQTLLISLGEASDLSTFLHESGHFFLEVMADIASTTDAPQDVVDDMNKVLAWFGVPDLATWNGYTLDQKRKHHEKWAESFEAYLFEGKAPSAELQPLFRRFRSWLVNVYKSLKQFMQGRDLGLNDDLRQVFDRMLATDAQIARAEEAAGMLPDFDATNEAIEKLQARSLRDLKWTVNARTKSIKALQKQAADLRKGVEAEVRAEVEQQPVYMAMRWLKKGETVDPQTGEAVKAEKGFRLNTAALAELYPETMLARPDLTGLKGMTAKDGLAPDMVADMFGFESGDKLVREILSAEPIDSVIQGIADRRMLERHGELVDQRAIEDAANDAIHNEARARALATELKSQSEMMNQRQDTGRTASNGRAITVNALTEAAKQFGADLASRRKIKDLKSAAWQHRAAEARAGKAWQEHTAAGKTEDAVRAKRDQLLNNHAAKALQEAQVEARKVLEFFRRVTKDGNEKTVEKGRDPDVVNAMRAILSAYGIAPRQGKSALEYMEIMAKNDPAMHGALAAGVNAALANAKPVDQMTMEELRGLNDEMRAMWYLAKRSRQMEVAGDLMDIEDAANELVVRMAELGVPVEVPGESGAMTPKEKAIRGLQHVGSLLRRVEQWAEGMDGKFGGPFLRLVFQPVKEAANRYRADRVKYRKRYQALVDAVGPYLRKGVIEAPELRYTFGKGHNGIGHAELLHAILHTGNESNKRKLLLGRKWATENADGTLDTTQWDAFINRMVNDGTLTKAHYDFAQGVWDLLEETKPLAQKAHRDVFGRYFAEVTADAFDTPFGQYRGGYVPAQADPRIVPDADMRDLVELENENMMFSFPATNRGFTKSRTEYNRPLMLDLRTIGQHIDKVLLFAHMEPHVRDVNKLLRQKGVSYSLNRIDPTAVPGMLTPWLKRSARQIVETPWVGDGGVSRVASVLRNRAGMALMFANVSNAIQQVTGFSTAFAKLKADGLQSHMMRATAQFIASPKETSRNVAQASSFMEGRMENEIAAINEAMDDILLDPNLYQKAQAWTRKHAYFLQSAFANTMEPIIWTAAYNAALEKGMTQDDAVRYADGLIRQTQGSTLPEDVSRAETGPAVLRMFTQFVGYFNMMANTNATGLKQIANEVGLKKGAGRALHLVTTGLLVPIWVAEAIAVAMRGGPEDEDDDGYLDDWLAAVFGFGTIKGAFAMVPVFGQAANAAVNRFNSNPADDRISASPAVSLLEAVAGVPSLLYKAMTDPDKINKRNAVRDVASAISLGTGLPAYAVARPLGYLAGVADERIEPTGPVDAVRGAVTGTPSPESR